MNEKTQQLDRVSAKPKKVMGFRTGLKKYPVVEVSRTFDAAVGKVWDAWTKPELVKQWWGPEGFTCPEAKMDVRVGGKLLLAMKEKNGETLWSTGEFKELLTNRRLVLTDQFSDAKGNPIPPSQVGMKGEWPDKLYITIDFTEIEDGKTVMELTHEGIPATMHDECVEGWSSSIDKLQRLVERRDYA